MAANGRCFLNQVDLKTGSAKIKSGLNTADPSADNHNIAKITVCETFTKLFNLFFFHFVISLLAHLSKGKGIASALCPSCGNYGVIV